MDYGKKTLLRGDKGSLQLFGMTVFVLGGLGIATLYSAYKSSEVRKRTVAKARIYEANVDFEANSVTTKAIGKMKCQVLQPDAQRLYTLYLMHQKRFDVACAIPAGISSSLDETKTYTIKFYKVDNMLLKSQLNLLIQRRGRYIHGYVGPENSAYPCEIATEVVGFLSEFLSRCEK